MTMTPEQDREFRAAVGEVESGERRNGHHPGASKIRRMSEVQSRTIKWAWKGRMALGYLTVWTGEEGLGKSVFCAWLAAQATRGGLHGDWHDTPVDVLIVAGEDGIEDTWKPRLVRAKADLRRASAFSLDEHPVDWNLRDGIEDLRQAILETNAKLVVFDSLLDQMPPPVGGENINSATFVRSALMPLKDLVRELDIVAVVSLHPPKARASAYRDLVQGSQAFTALTRFGLLFGWHPDDAEDDPMRRRVVLRGKGNRGRNPGAIEFNIIGEELCHDDGIVQEVEGVTNVRPSDVTMRQLLSPARGSDTDEPANKAELAAEIIRDALSDGEWHDSAPIRELLEETGLGSGSVLTGAKRLANVESQQRPGAAHGGWKWRIPAQIPSPVSLSTVESDPDKGPNPQHPRSGSQIPSSATVESDGPGARAVVPVQNEAARGAQDGLKGRTAADLTDDELLALFPGSTLEHLPAHTNGHIPSGRDRSQ
jgi:AAA domain-containing protein